MQALALEGRGSALEGLGAGAGAGAPGAGVGLCRKVGGAAALLLA